MTRFTTIDEIAEFINTGWPGPKGAWYFEDLSEIFDTELTVNSDGLYLPVTPGKIVDARLFYASLAWQGQAGEDPTDGGGHDFLKLFRAWKKAKVTSTLVIEFPKSREKEIRDALKTLGVKVHGKSN